MYLLNQEKNSGIMLVVSTLHSTMYLLNRETFADTDVALGALHSTMYLLNRCLAVVIGLFGVRLYIPQCIY